VKKVSFLELCHSFDGQVKLPYSTGCIWSYCQSIQEVCHHYQLLHWEYALDEDFNVNETAERLSESDVLGVSYFVWNTRITDLVCKKVKEFNPDCSIVYGGLGSTPDLVSRPYVDHVIMYEGEKQFADFLLKRQRLFHNEKEEFGRIDVAQMPSPYLDGLFDSLPDRKWEAIIEPIRGCPYSCTFCEIGDKYYTNICRNEKVFDEIEWVSDNKIEYMHLVDNNYGMLPWHGELTDFIIDKAKTGYPNALNISWAKVKKPHLYEMAKKLDDAGLSKGVTIALQSLNPDTLKAIKRTNGNVKETIDKLKEIDVQAHVELIMGLPEESVHTFKEGIYTLLDEYDYHKYVDIYPLVALPNTPFGTDKYIKEWNINVKSLPPVFTHHDYQKEKLLEDSNDLAFAMDEDDYRELLLWRWFITSTHFLGWTRDVAREINLTCREFYDTMYKYIDENDTVLGREKKITDKLLRSFLSGESLWGRQMGDIYFEDYQLGDASHYGKGRVSKRIFWEYEEATAIEIQRHKGRFYDELFRFLIGEFDIEAGHIISQQMKRMRDPEGNVYKWCKECMWWGRRVERFYVS